MIIQKESDMDFHFDPNLVFLPEESETYKNLAKRNGIKTCDFIWLKNEKKQQKLYFVEAKESAPDFKNIDTKEKVNLENKFAKYINEIHNKMIHSLGLYLSMITDRLPTSSDFPDTLKKLDFKTLKIVPILIVKKHKNDWVVSLRDMLIKELKGIKKAFQLEDIIVLNEKMASKKGFLKRE